MSAEPSLSRSIGFWRTVGILLRVARRRSLGRMQRQQQLLHQRTGSSADTLGLLAAIGLWALMGALHAAAGYVLYQSVLVGQRVEVLQQGKVIAGTEFIDALRQVENAQSEDEKKAAAEKLEHYYESEAFRRFLDYDENRSEAESYLREAVKTRTSSDFIDAKTVEQVFATSNAVGRLSAMLATLVLIWWLITLSFQGEGLELDLQRRRHPMWEWLFSHPVKPGAVFFAEMLSPIVANPMYSTAPIFFAIFYGFTYTPQTGVVAAIVIGVPVAIAAACIGKALEIGVILRFPPRSRGALIGFMSWLGYAAMMSFVFVAAAADKVIPAVARLLHPLATLVPWPWFAWSIGMRSDSSLSFLSGMLFWWLIAAVMIGGGVWFSVWGTQRGLGGSSDAKPVRSAKRVFSLPFLRKDPLYRKEVLWFLRDRGAIVQTILVPITIAALQLFNLRGLAERIPNSWQYLSGVAVIFGTYFLWILGPRSLASEGAALWVAQTWPKGLEALMKAKAKLWFLIANGLVTLVLIFTLVRFPGDWWKVVLIGIGWYAFGRSMAAKSVTLVPTPTSSGEAEPVPRGRRWAASLGMLTFAVGILGQRWSLAIVGIVYSWLTAAAMWQNFRARLPYLFDPWSEKVPPAPTLMHAMIAISALVEGGSVITGLFMAVFAQFGGTEMVPIVQAIVFGVVAIIVWFVTSEMLSDRGVKNTDVWRWGADRKYGSRFFASLTIGAVCGLLLALFALAYVSVLLRIEPFTEMVRVAEEQAGNVPNLWIGLFIVGVFFAPFAEEYLFRGLLFRALDQEWGGWRALLGSAAFFAIYHPPISWLPVALVGLACAMVFKKTGRLAPAVVLHMVYNAVVIGGTK